MITRRHFSLAAASLLASPALARERVSRNPPKRNRKQRGQPTPGPAFTHGVASGEPGADQLSFWTRHFDGTERPAPLQLELATDPGMENSRIVAQTTSDPARDHTARATVGGLAPGTTYHYRWLGPDNSMSVRGRTRTLAASGAPQLRLGVFACANPGDGWFNGYGHAAAADDIDLVVHLGHYLCLTTAHPAAPRPAQAIAGRPALQPANPQTLAEHWAHYRTLRADPDLLALHARHPFIAQFDDHRLGKGLSAAATVAALAAWRDWMPVSNAAYARYELGGLATLFRLDTSLSGRDPPLDFSAATGNSNPLLALGGLRDDAWVDGARQFLGLEQERWLLAAMEADARRGIRRQILAQSAMMALLRMPSEVVQLAGAAAPAELRTDALLTQAGLPINLGGWSGYPAARARLLATAQRQGIDLVSLSCGNHNAWGSDLPNGGRPAGVEFATPSVTSPGLDALFPDPAASAGAMVRANPSLRFADFAHRGYLHLLLTPAQTVGEWRFTQAGTARSSQLAATAIARTAMLERRLVMG